MTKIRGVIIPVKWDEKGKPIDIAISANNEDEYILAEGSKKDELLRHVQREVEVVGNIEDGKKKRILVRSYSIL